MANISMEWLLVNEAYRAQNSVTRVGIYKIYRNDEDRWIVSFKPPGEDSFYLESQNSEQRAKMLCLDHYARELDQKEN